MMQPETINTHHFKVVRGFLAGEKTNASQLWLSTGYFLHGHGRWFTKPWKTKEEKQKLIQAREARF